MERNEKPSCPDEMELVDCHTTWGQVNPHCIITCKGNDGEGKKIRIQGCSCPDEERVALLSGDPECPIKEKIIDATEAVYISKECAQKWGVLSGLMGGSVFSGVMAFIGGGAFVAIALTSGFVLYKVAKKCLLKNREEDSEEGDFTPSNTSTDSESSSEDSFDSETSEDSFSTDSE